MTGQGKSVRVAVTGRYRRDDGGHLEGVVLALRPIERRNTLAASGVEVVSTVSHELRSPLTSVKGYTSLLLNRWDRLDDDQKKSMLEQVQHDADRVTRLITELLDISRLETGRLRLRCQMIDIAALAEVVVEKVRIGHPELSVSVTFPGDLPRVYADPDKVEQVLTNLLENAAKYADSPDVRVEGVYEEGRKDLRIAVHDVGKGIPAGRAAPAVQQVLPGLGGRSARAGRVSVSTSPGVWWRPTAGASPPRAGWGRVRRSPSRSRPTPSRRPSETETAARDSGGADGPARRGVGPGPERDRQGRDGRRPRRVERTFLGKRSAVVTANQGIKDLSPDERPRAGQAVSSYKAGVTEVVEARRAALGDGAGEAVDRLDLTLPGRGAGRGHLHLITQVQQELEEVFLGFGYEVAEGPEVETDFYNFEALNMPPAHPARSMWDTLYVKLGRAEEVVLRTHTSPVQIRVMESRQPPVYTVMPGRCYRRDTLDARHSPVFHQIEGLVVDRGITFGDLAGTIDAFTRAYFGPGHTSRLRPSYFPFTEPSAEFEVTCFACDGAGCSVCSKTGLAGARRLRDGRPQRVPGRRLRLRDLHRVRLRVRAGADGHGPVRRRAHQVVLRERRPVPEAVLNVRE